MTRQRYQGQNEQDSHEEDGNFQGHDDRRTKLQENLPEKTGNTLPRGAQSDRERCVEFTTLQMSQGSQIACVGSVAHFFGTIGLSQCLVGVAFGQRPEPCGQNTGALGFQGE